MTSGPSYSLTKTFTALGDANAFFSNNPIDLGPIAGVSGVSFELDVSTSEPGDSYTVNLIDGDATLNMNSAPEPSSIAFGSMIGVAMLLRRRHGAVSRRTD